MTDGRSAIRSSRDSGRQAFAVEDPSKENRFYHTGEAFESLSQPAFLQPIGYRFDCRRKASAETR
jgi:hypothetical protein